MSAPAAQGEGSAVARLGAPVQIAYAVPDAIAAAEVWARDCGAGPFFVRQHIPVTDVLYRGQPSEFDHTSAYGQWGSLMVELVQDHGSEPSAVRELYSADQSGLHHMAFFVDDIDAALDQLATQDMPLAMDAYAGATRFVFVDALAQLGHFLELYVCLLYTSPSPRDATLSRMPSSA